MVPECLACLYLDLERQLHSSEVTEKIPQHQCRIQRTTVASTEYSLAFGYRVTKG